MKIVVCARAAAWLEDEIELTGDGLSVDPDLLGYELSDADQCAIEAALRLAEGPDRDVVLVSAGSTEADGPLRRGLAMGADRAIRLQAGTGLSDPLSVAALLAPAVAAEHPRFVLCGSRSADTGNAATGTALAAHLGWPCATMVSRVSVHDGHALVHRSLEGGLIDVVELRLPAVITIATGSYEPRHPTLKALKAADDAVLDVRKAEPPPPASSVVARMYLPSTENTARMLDGEPAEVAATVADLITGRVP